MQHFSIRDIENLSGIKAHTLRIWEQRYGLNLCKRRESQHRYYDNEDLKKVLRISYLYHNGYKISCIANLRQEEIVQLASKGNACGDYEIFVNQMIEACIDYDQQLMETVLNNVIINMGLEAAVVKVIYPFMEKIGVLWMTNHVVPAQEHFSSQIIQKKFIAAIDALPRLVSHPSRLFLLFAPEGEFHEIPVLFAHYLFKKSGHKTVFLGKDTSIETLQYYCTHQLVTHLYFHLITNFTNQEPADYLVELANQFPDKKIVASGPALREVDITVPNTLVLRSLGEMISFAKKS